jgi:hypothetical protein
MSCYRTGGRVQMQLMSWTPGWRHGKPQHNLELNLLTWGGQQIRVVCKLIVGYSTQWGAQVLQR